MRKSVIRQYEHHRRYDFGEAKEGQNRNKIKFHKRRARRRLRHSQAITLDG